MGYGGLRYSISVDTPSAEPQPKPGFKCMECPVTGTFLPVPGVPPTGGKLFRTDLFLTQPTDRPEEERPIPAPFPKTPWEIELVPSPSLPLPTAPLEPLDVFVAPLVPAPSIPPTTDRPAPHRPTLPWTVENVPLAPVQDGPTRFSPSPIRTAPPIKPLTPAPEPRPCPDLFNLLNDLSVVLNAAYDAGQTHRAQAIQTDIRNVAAAIRRFRETGECVRPPLVSRKYNPDGTVTEIVVKGLRGSKLRLK